MSAEESLSHENRKPWVVVLAGGRGTRLRQLSAALHGQSIPKQFALLDGLQSPLQSAVKRALWLTTQDRVLVVVCETFRKLAASQLEAFPLVKLVVQPTSGGTALGILLPMLMLEEKHAAEDVVVMPADHHFERPLRFTDAVQSVLDERRRGDSLVLMGADSTEARSDVGWIMPIITRESSPLAAVSKFVEKPSLGVAERLLNRGGLLSTFVTVATVRGFMHAFTQHLPKATRALRGSVKLRRWNAIGFAFGAFGGVDFSRSVLERLSDLLVFRVPECGWQTIGASERVVSAFGAHSFPNHNAGPVL
jgi:mannose-1-phosphate guanylyltransferase